MIEALKPYAEYKESGGSWLGNVPEHWKVQRQRNVVQMLVSNVDKHTKEDEIPVRLCNYVDVYKNDRITDRLAFMRATASKHEIERFRLQIGDVIITKDSEEWNDIGVPALVEHSAPDLVCGYHLAILRPRDGIALGAYLLRALQSQGVASQLYVAANGVTRYGLSMDAIKSVVLPVPPLPEQSAIARYLDTQDRRINRFIRTKRRLIELLNEKKQVIINRAVTHGIDTNVRLKPSGIEWLGEVPEHWRLHRLKYLVHNVIEQTNEKHPGDVYIALENIESWTGHLSLPSGDVAFDSQVKRFQAEDILFGKLRPYLAKVTRPKQKGVCVGELFVLQIANNEILPEFIEQKLRSKQLIDHINSSTFGAKMPRADWTFVGNVLIAYPPEHEEQKSILTTINTKTVELQSAIMRTRREIDLLREFRTRLISDVVTGKLNVHGVELPAMDEAETLGDIDTVEDIETEVEDLIESEEVADADE